MVALKCLHVYGSERVLEKVQVRAYRRKKKLKEKMSRVRVKEVGIGPGTKTHGESPLSLR